MVNFINSISLFTSLLTTMSPHEKKTNSLSLPPSEDYVTILGFGSLLSEKSSRLTFPNLINFRQGSVPSYRRVFAHPASIFFKRGIACMDTLQISSLSAEYSPGNSFICSIFEVPSEGIWETESNSDDNEDDRNGNNNGTNNTSIITAPSQAFLEREEEFNIITVKYHEEDGQEKCNGILCTRSTDEEYLKTWGHQRFHDNYKRWGVTTIWGWEYDSGIRPCAVYLRHCLLAAKSVGDDCLDSFLDQTFLVDRETTLRTYVDKYPEIWNILPPDELAERYGG